MRGGAGPGRGAGGRLGLWPRSLALTVALVLGGLAAGMAPLGPGAAPLGAVAASPSQRPLFGAFTVGGVWDGMGPIRHLESLLGHRLAIVHWYMSWSTPYDVSLVKKVLAGGHVPMITWQPDHASVAAIASGREDAVIRAFADGVRATPGVVYVRPFPEMNGDWEPWNGDPAEFVKAWRHMVDVFRAEGATNVRWVWCPNVTDQPATPANAMERYYPGTAYVDVLALDGYNWGTGRPWSRWLSFDQIFAKPYARITALGPQPVWIAEVASTSVGGDKAAWVRGMLSSTRFPRIRALVWFNENGDMDWRLDNSLAVVQAVRFGLGPEPGVVASR